MKKQEKKNSTKLMVKNDALSFNVAVIFIKIVSKKFESNYDVSYFAHLASRV